MTTTDDETTGEVLHFDAPAPAPEAEQEARLIRFTVGDDPTVLVARKPKAAVLIRLARAGDSKDPLVLAGLYDEFMDAVLLPESADYLRDRFEDPDDEWDYEVLSPVLDTLKGRWFARPTGRPTASARSRRPTGKRSTGRARSGG